jgi:hypothetical protein
MKKDTGKIERNPLQQVDLLYEALVADYGLGKDRELRAAAKLLVVALEKFREYGGPDWSAKIEEYVSMIRENPEKFDRILHNQRRPA